MAKWNNFEIWLGKWPHWRAEGVTYHVSFKHRRPLEGEESQALFRALLRAQGKGLDFMVLCVLPERSEALVQVVGDRDLSDWVEKAKLKAGKEIVKKSGERFPPFGGESYDRIMRDDEELETVFVSIVSGPGEVTGDDGDDWPTLYVRPE